MRLELLRSTIEDAIDEAKGVPKLQIIKNTKVIVKAMMKMDLMKNLKLMVHPHLCLRLLRKRHPH